MKFARFIAGRIVTFLLVIWIGMTAVFFIPRMFPADPVEGMIMKMTANQGSLDPKEVEHLRQALNTQFGLEGSTASQYFTFLYNVFIKFDFGPSFTNFPTPVMELIGRAMPYTLGLLLCTTTIAWLLGNTIGLLAGFRKDKWYSKMLEGIAIFIYPIPYYIVALIFLVVFCFILRIFPLTPIFAAPELSFFFLGNIIKNSIMPACSLLLVGMGWWIISMRSLSSSVAEEDYVHYARLKGLSEGKVARKYVFPNSILPQITALALSIGGVFSGSIMCEVMFGYPGVGVLMQTAINTSDYNLIMGTVSASIIAVATTTLIVDLINPFIDPRIRYK